MELNDLRVLVTGATAGIGRETAKLFARRGATVVATGRNAERGEQTVAAIVAEGGQAEFLAADMNDPRSVRRLADQVGEIDVLVNNAAVFPFAPTLEQDIDSFDMMFAINVRGPFFLTAALLPKMIARGSGAIVNVSTAAASASLPEAPVYGATKAALTHLSASLRADLAPYDVRVTNIEPGLTDTELATHLDAPGQDLIASMNEQIGPLHADDIADVVTFAVSRRRELNLRQIVALPTRQA